MEEQKAESFHCSTPIPNEKQLKDDFEVLEYLRLNKHKEYFRNNSEKIARAI